MRGAYKPVNRVVVVGFFFIYFFNHCFVFIYVSSVPALLLACLHARFLRAYSLPALVCA